ncbi:hypothetical protein PI124_g19044 [Phytophthora idaei]|nr:hypothetical protein PI124_g19044 [Phytophthora idaei]
MTHESAASEESTSCDDGESVAGVCGSLVIDDEVDHDSDVELEDAGIHGEDITVASTIASMDNEEHIEQEEMHGDQNDTQVSREVIDAAAKYQQQIGKRANRDETSREVLRVERHTDKLEPKRTRTGLREYRKRRRPAYLDDYVVNAVQRASRIKDQNGKYIRVSSVKIPRNRREARRPKFAGFWDLAEADEITALKTKGVIVEISSDGVPNDAKLLTTGWVYALKSDHEGYVIRFKARIVAFGNYQRPGIDFCETFSPVAQMSSFRMLVALAAALHLKLYGGDINTAYLNAMLAIRQYLRSIDGFPCAVDGHVYMVVKALYGLRQSGREWNSELNQWLLGRGYQRSMTEPCLYYRFDGNTIMLILVYVDDIMVATNEEEGKKNLFDDLDTAYGIKDQGLLTQYLGIEMAQTDDSVTNNQSKYAREILETFGYSQAHAVGNPMETNVKLVPLGESEDADTSFEYRKAVGMLMYLATGTRPDLAFAVGQLSRFVAKPSAKHVGTLKRVLRYLAGTVGYGITYERANEVPSSVALEGYCDSDWANDPESRKSTTGFVFTLAGGAISWMSRRQSIVALSTAEPSTLPHVRRLWRLRRLATSCKK